MEAVTTEHRSAPLHDRRRARRRRLAGLVLAAFAATATLTACPEKKGPAEKAGEAIDDAGKSLKDAVTPDGPAEDLGEKIDDATK